MGSKLPLLSISIYVFISFVVTSCLPISTDEDLAGSENCHPPCWEGIQPGVTEQREAIEVLEGLSADGSESLMILPESIRWQSESGKIYLLTVRTSLINSIELEIYSTTVEDLLSLFGVPSYFLVDNIQKDAYSVLLLYPDDGLAFRAATNRNRKLQIDPDMSVIDAIYSKPNALPVFLQAIYGNKYDDVILDSILTWKGYGDVAP